MIGARGVGDGLEQSQRKRRLLQQRTFIWRHGMNTVEAGSRIVLKNILFATDFSPCSNAALPYALSVARRHRATLHAAYVMPTDADLLFMSPESWVAVAEEDEKRIQGYIKQLEGK